MKAMVLAAGRGSRLGRITESTPKCLVDIGRITMLEHVFAQLAAAGVTSVVVNLFYLGHAVRQFIEDRNGLGMQVDFSEESELLGTGGGLLHAREYLDGEESFFVHNADIYSELPLAPLAEEHARMSGVATLSVMERDTRRLLLFDDAMHLRGWENLDGGRELVGEKVRTPNRLAFSGIQLVSPRIFPYLESCGTVSSLIEGYLAAVQAGESVLGYIRPDSTWIDVGRPAHLEELRHRRSGNNSG